MPLHTDALSTDTFTHRGFDTQRLDTQTRLDTDAFTERERELELRRTRQNCKFTSVFDDRTSFRAKGLRPKFQNHHFTAVF